MDSITAKLKALPEFDYQHMEYLDFEKVCWDDGKPAGEDTFVGWRVTLMVDDRGVYNAYGSIMANTPDEGWTENVKPQKCAYAPTLTSLRQFAEKLQGLDIHISIGEGGKVDLEKYTEKG